jgi:hypothetical protein
MARIPKTKVYNPQKAEAYVGKRVLRNGDTLPAIKGAITPVPNGHLIKKDGTSLKSGGKIDAFSKVKKAMKSKKQKMFMDKVKKNLYKVQPIKKENGGKVTVRAGGEKHLVYKKTSPTGIGKGKKGNIMVNHPTKDKGKWDTIDLTKIGRAKTVKQGVASTKKWHKDNPDYKYKGKKK